MSKKGGNMNEYRIDFKYRQTDGSIQYDYSLGWKCKDIQAAINDFLEHWKNCEIIEILSVSKCGAQ